MTLPEKRQATGRKTDQDQSPQRGNEIELRLSTLPDRLWRKMAWGFSIPAMCMLRTFDSTGLFRRGSAPLGSPWFISPKTALCWSQGRPGSGKTTTLYTTLSSWRTPRVNVCTIEDPIELVGRQLNSDAGTHAISILDFAGGVRALMRTGPGYQHGSRRNTRPRRLRKLADQGSLTGHLVLLRPCITNDAPIAISA